MSNPERPWTDEMQAAEVARLAALSAAGGGKPEDVTVEWLAQFGVMPHEATPENVASAAAQSAKAAHDEALLAELPPEQARSIAFAVRAEPAKASQLLTAAVSKAVGEALAAAAEPA